MKKKFKLYDLQFRIMSGFLRQMQENETIDVMVTSRGEGMPSGWYALKQATPAKFKAWVRRHRLTELNFDMDFIRQQDVLHDTFNHLKEGFNPVFTVTLTTHSGGKRKPSKREFNAFNVGVQHNPLIPAPIKAACSFAYGLVLQPRDFSVWCKIRNEEWKCVIQKPAKAAMKKPRKN